MNFLLNTNKKKIIVSILSMPALFFVLYQCIMVQSNIFERYSSFVIYPFLVVYHHCIDPIKKRVIRIHKADEFQQVIENLRNERDVLAAENIVLRASHLYAQETRDMLLFQERYNTLFACNAHILVRHFSDYAHYFLVDAGEQQGITVDMVAVYKNCLVGRVIEVYPWYSKVQLITDR